MRMRRGEPFVLTGPRSSDVIVAAILDGQCHILNRVEPDTMLAMREDDGDALGIPVIYKDDGNGVSVWPLPDDDYEVELL